MFQTFRAFIFFKFRILSTNSLVGMDDVRGVFNAAPPKRKVKSRIAREETPEFDSVHNFNAMTLSVPGNAYVEVLLDFRAINVISVPEALLFDCGIEAQFEHVSVFVSEVAAG